MTAVSAIRAPVSMTGSVELSSLQQDKMVRDAVRVIQESPARIALVVDSEGRLVGTITDGDVRRGLLRGVGMDDNLSAIVNRHPATSKAGENQRTLMARMKRDRLRQMPVVDAEGRVLRIEVGGDLAAGQRKDNIVVIMAGGLGQRLRPLTAEKPKPMLEVGDKPILEGILESFIELGFHRFFFAVNYKRELVEAHFGSGERWGVAIDYLREEEPLGTAGALSLLGEQPTQPLFIMNGDVLTKVNFEDLLSYHEEHGCVATVGVREHVVSIPFGVVDHDGYRLTGLREKPVLQFLVNAGIYVLDPAALRLIPPRRRFDMPDLLLALAAGKQEVSVFPIREYWIDIGQMEDFERANGEFDQVFR